MPQAPKSYGSCWRKSRYKTENRADKYARKFEKRYGDPMRAYYCGVCGGWHLTSWRDKPEEKSKSKPKETK